MGSKTLYPVCGGGGDDDDVKDGCLDKNTQRLVIGGGISARDRARARDQGYDEVID